TGRATSCTTSRARSSSTRRKTFSMTRSRCAKCVCDVWTHARALTPSAGGDATRGQPAHPRDHLLRRPVTDAQARVAHPGARLQSRLACADVSYVLVQSAVKAPATAVPGMPAPEE